MIVIVVGTIIISLIFHIISGFRTAVNSIATIGRPGFFLPGWQYSSGLILS